MGGGRLLPRLDRPDPDRALDGAVWNVVPGQNPGTSNILFGVSAAADGTMWAVGGQGRASGPPLVLTERWDGVSWSVVKGRNPGTDYNRLGGVAAISSADAFAGGTYLNSGENVERTLAERYC